MIMSIESSFLPFLLPNFPFIFVLLWCFDGSIQKATGLPLKGWLDLVRFFFFFKKRNCFFILGARAQASRVKKIHNLSMFPERMEVQYVCKHCFDK